jgi:hypothetical protein
MFTKQEDIANRALQHLGANLITLFSDNSKNAVQCQFIYDKVRRAELRANPWNFSRRRAVLRQLTNPSWILTFGAYNGNNLYNLGDIVSYNQALWVSLANANTGLSPLNGFPWTEYVGPSIVPQWAPGAYYLGEVSVTGAGVAFINYINGNTLAPVTGMHSAASGWHAIGFAGTQNSLGPLTPLGYTTNLLPNPSRNIYPVPAAYVRTMMQDPKTAAAPVQITSGGNQALDYELEQGCLLTAATGPIIFRFGADLQIVTWFDDMFCEAVAARMATGLCEVITQSPQKLQAIDGAYNDAITKAIRVNAIEAGATEPDTLAVDSQRGPTRERQPQPPRQQQQ